MSANNMLVLVIITSFSLIHLIEVSSYLTRIVGGRLGDRALSFTLQNAIFMTTRFFSMLVLPILGLLIDRQIAPRLYLEMILSALLGATLLSALAILYRERTIAAFSTVCRNVKRRKSLMFELMKAPLYFCINPSKIDAKKWFDISVFRHRLFWFASFVFSVYSLSLFLAFYIALLNHDYRATLSQLSAVTNAFATVVLTFFIEPRISIALDAGGELEPLISALLLGRIFGIGVYSTSIVSTLWLLN